MDTSIDAPEPIFGLAVTGRVAIKHLKENSKAQVGDKIYLTKPLGIGILTTAQKQKKITPEDEQRAIETMCQLNDIGAKLAKIEGVNAITDVTGFGLGGHLVEVCQGSNVSATVNYSAVPTLPNIQSYLADGCSPGGAQRNFDSYGQHLSSMNGEVQSIICDPQTSGGLLIMVSGEAQAAFEKIMQSAGFNASAIGEILPSNNNTAIVTINE